MRYAIPSAPLLRVYTGNGIEGSNPFLFASAALKVLTLWRNRRLQAKSARAAEMLYSTQTPPMAGYSQALRLFVLACTCLTACALPALAQPVTSIYWHDGDSGRVNGMDFRLANVDAPETGGVGSINGARCEAEREAGFAAKAFIIEATRGRQLVITGGDAKPDKWDRHVVTLSVDGRDLGALAVASGHLKPYIFENGRSKTKKPKWC